MKLSDIKALIEAATPGIANGVMFQDEFEPPTFEVYTENDGCLGKFERQADADLFQASRTLMPKLLAVAEAAKADHVHWQQQDYYGCKICAALAALEAE